MGEVMSLWLPILVAAVVVFFASFVSWMLLPFHKADFKELPDEDGLFQVLKSSGVAPGQYMFPHCADPSMMKDPAYKKKWEAGPHGSLLVSATVPNFGRNLALVFLFYVVVGFFVAYIGAAALAPGAAGGKVLQVTGCAATLAYAFGAIPNAIFFGKPLRATALDVVDGVIYGVLTGIVFAWMWPAAEATISLPG
jgi:hypothetical protein